MRPGNESNSVMVFRETGQPILGCPKEHALRQLSLEEFRLRRQEAYSQCKRRKIRRVFQLGRREIEEVEGHRLSNAKYGKLLGISGSQVSRYQSGKIEDTPDYRLDQYLRKIGRRLDDIQPDELELDEAILAHTLAETTRLRGISLDGVDHQLILWIAKECPRPPPSTWRDSEAWQNWCEHTIRVLQTKIDHGSLRGIDRARIRKLHWIVVSAGDWLAISHDLRWGTPLITDAITPHNPEQILAVAGYIQAVRQLSHKAHGPIIKVDRTGPRTGYRNWVSGDRLYVGISQVDQEYVRALGTRQGPALQRIFPFDLLRTSEEGIRNFQNTLSWHVDHQLEAAIIFDTGKNVPQEVGADIASLGGGEVAIDLGDLELDPRWIIAEKGRRKKKIIERVEGAVEKIDVRVSCFDQLPDVMKEVRWQMRQHREHLKNMGTLSSLPIK